MVEKILLHTSTKKHTFPVIATLYNKKTKEILMYGNTKPNDNKSTNEHHAETKAIIDIVKSLNKDLILIISLPPCDFCLKRLNKMGGNIEILYISDYAGKRHKPYISKTKHSIEMISFEDENTDIL